MGRLKMSSHLNKNLINLSKGLDTLGLKEQIKILEEKISTLEIEHEKQVTQLNKKQAEDMKITPEEYRRIVNELNEKLDIISSKDKQIQELKQDIRNLNEQTESMFKSKDDTFMKEKSQFEFEITNQKVRIEK